MKEKVYYAARINLSGRADLVLFGANICIEKRLTDKQAKHAIQKAIAHQLLQGSDGENTQLPLCTREKRFLYNLCGGDTGWELRNAEMAKVLFINWRMGNGAPSEQSAMTLPG